MHYRGTTFGHSGVALRPVAGGGYFRGTPIPMGWREAQPDSWRANSPVATGWDDARFRVDDAAGLRAQPSAELMRTSVALAGL